MNHSIAFFLKTFEIEGKRTLQILQALPEGKYDFRPDAGGRSLGELAWHLAEIEAYTGVGIENGKMDFSVKIPEAKRPLEIAALAKGYEIVHRDTLTRFSKVTDEDMTRVITFFPGMDLPIHEILWSMFLLHQIHHRGQLSLMTRLASAVAPGIYGPNREETQAMRNKKS